MKSRRRFVIAGAIAVACVIVLIFVGHWLGWQTGFGPQTTEPKQHAKTLWDWMQLLIIPAVLAVGGYLFNFANSRTERDIAADNQGETALKEYIDKMSELLLKEHLRELIPNYENVQKIARVRTLIVLRRLDAERKGSVLSFLYESTLINKDMGHIDLDGADLSGVYRPYLGDICVTYAILDGANLNWVHLPRAVFEGTRLYEVTLIGADLSEAILPLVDLSKANLTDAKLIKACLILAKLQNADLTGADLSGADLTSADLTGAKVTPEQLATTRSLKGATMPDGSKRP